jgi:hypothetical protein
LDQFYHVQGAGPSLVEENRRRQEGRTNRKRGYNDEDEVEHEDQVEVEDEVPRGKRSRPSTESKARISKRQKEEESTASPLKDDRDISKERQRAAEWAEKMGYGKKQAHGKQPHAQVLHLTRLLLTSQTINLICRNFNLMMLTSFYRRFTRVVLSFIVSTYT